MKYLIWLSSDCASLDETISALKNGGHEIGVLLVQDGVFMADKGCSHSKELISHEVPLFATKDHVEERGLTPRLIHGVKTIDYSEMVETIMEVYDRVISI